LPALTFGAHFKYNHDIFETLANSNTDSA